MGLLANPSCLDGGRQGTQTGRCRQIATHQAKVLCPEKKHSGITQDRERRQAEHQTRWPGGTLQTVIGPVSEKDARSWEARQTKIITPERR